MTLLTYPGSITNSFLKVSAFVAKHMDSVREEGRDLVGPGFGRGGRTCRGLKSRVYNKARLHCCLLRERITSYPKIGQFRMCSKNSIMTNE